MKRVIENMATLKKKAIEVTPGMETYFPQFGVGEMLRVTELASDLQMRFAYNNSVVAFVDEEGTFYVIPDLKGTQRTLEEAGYEKAYFYVPFSNWDYPVAKEKEWKALWKEKNGEYKI